MAESMIDVQGAEYATSANALRQKQRQEVHDAVVKDSAGTIDERQSAVNLREKINIVRYHAEQVQSLLESGTGVNSGDPADHSAPRHKAIVTQVTITEILKAYKVAPNLYTNAVVTTRPDSPSARVIRRLSEKIINPEGEISPESSPYLHKILHKAINSTVANPLEVLNEREMEFLYSIDPVMHGKVKEALAAAARDGGHPAEEIKAFIEREEVRKNANTSAEMERMQRHSQEFSAMLEKFQEPADRKLILALYSSPQQFSDYLQNEEVRQFAASIPRFRTVPLDQLLADEEFDKLFSKHLKGKITMLIGKLYLQADESDPGEFWEQVEQKGGIWSNIGTLRATLERQIQALRLTTFDDNAFVKKMKWFVEDFEKVEIDRPVKPPHYHLLPKELQEEYGVSRMYTTAFDHEEQMSFTNYFESVLNSVKTEVEIRGFSHNSRALYHNPPGEGGYYGQLSHYADKEMKSRTHDEIMRMVDADKMLLASRIQEKVFRSNFARHNWNWQAGTDQLQSSNRMTPTEEESYKYLMAIHQKEFEENENAATARYKRVSAMASGDNYSIGMRFLELGAYADPPKKPNGEVDYSSYGQRDAAPYLVFNNFGHLNLRFSSDSLLIGNLFFLPVEGAKLDKFGVWDHTQVMDQMRNGINAFTSGQRPEDAAEGIMRMVDYLNPAKVGSIYSRGGWRTFGAYEIYMLDPSNGEYIPPDKGWKAVENIGLEILLDFVKNSSLNPDSFYTKKDKETDRKALAEHIYKKYYHQGDGDPDAGTVSRKIAELESSPHRAKAYKEFMLGAIANATMQRIPMTILCLERTRDVNSRRRLWELVRKEVVTDASFTGESDSLKTNQYDIAVKDIGVAEALLRDMVTHDMKGKIEHQRHGNQGETVRMHDINLSIKYDLHTHLDDLLKEIVPDLPREAGETDDHFSNRNRDNELRRTRAKLVFAKAQSEIKGMEGGKYLDKFVEKWRDGKMPFVVALDELERSFLVHSNTGDRTIARAIHEIADSEKKVTETFGKYFETLRNTASNNKKDYSEIVAQIKTARDMVFSMHGYNAANRIAHHMAMIAITYFKKDTLAKPLGGVFGINTTNSMAAEFAGGRSSAVWEWDSRVIDHFITTLENNDIISRLPYEKNKLPTY